MERTEVPKPVQQGTTWSTRSWQLWLHALWTVLIVGGVIAVLISLALSKPGPDDCEGIGWGCNLYGGDAALFAAIFLVPHAIGLVLVGNVIIAVAGWLSGKRRAERDRDLRSD
jgi:hypothetical protein